MNFNCPLDLEIQGTGSADSSVATIDARLAQLESPQTPDEIAEKEYLLKLRAKKAG